LRLLKLRFRREQRGIRRQLRLGAVQIGLSRSKVSNGTREAAIDVELRIGLDFQRCVELAGPLCPTTMGVIDFSGYDTGPGVLECCAND
jgi:hypothetical protein